MKKRTDDGGLMATGNALSGRDLAAEGQQARALRTVISRAALFDTPSQAVIATTVEGGIIYWSRTAEQMYGWAGDEVMGLPIVDVTPSDQTRAQAIAIMDRLRKGRGWAGEFTVQSRDKSSFQVTVQNLPVQDEIGKLIGILGVSTKV